MFPTVMRSKVCGYSACLPINQINSLLCGRTIYSICCPSHVYTRQTSINSRTFRDNARNVKKTRLPSVSDTISTSKHGDFKQQDTLRTADNSGSALKKIQKALGNASSPYTVHGAAEVLFKKCSKHAAYKTPLVDTEEEIPTTEDGEEIGISDEQATWHTEFGFPATFSTWSQITMLHMYLFIVRIRNAPPEQVKIWQRCLQDQFFYAAEDRMVVNHNMQAGIVRSRYLKDLYVQWRGLIAAYDEGIAKGDAVLAAAIWRNIFKAREDFDVRHLAQIVSYIRHSLQKLETVLLITNLVDFEFSSLGAEKAAVLLPSPMLKEPFDKPTS